MADPTKPDPKEPKAPESEPAKPLREPCLFFTDARAKGVDAFVTARSEVDPNVATVVVKSGGEMHKSIVRWAGRGKRPNHPHYTGAAPETEDGED